MNRLKKKLRFIRYLVRYSVNLLHYPFMNTEAIFKDIYEKNIWDNSETVSGDSSTLQQTVALRQALPNLIKKYKVKSMLDIPCGDFNWMQSVDLKLDYIGADIVDTLIERNSNKFPDAGKFIQLDICNDSLPQADLIFCRDCLNHLSNKKIFATIENIKKSNAKYILVTTFPDRLTNKNTLTGAWRALNFEAPPFAFPPPLEVINENFRLRGGRFQDKSMGLWKIRDLP